jgi:hypothetical protein
MVERVEDAHSLQVLEVIADALGRIVGQKRVPDPQAVQFGQERAGKVEQRATPVDGSIHVQGHVPNTTDCTGAHPENSRGNGPQRQPGVKAVY